jgi:hypothetical protein
MVSRQGWGFGSRRDDHYQHQPVRAASVSITAAYWGGADAEAMSAFGLGFAGEHAAVELVNHARHVSLCFVVGRDAVIAIDGERAGVVGREREGHVVVVAGEERVEIGGAATDILLRLKAVCDAEFIGGSGHELHEAARSSAADGADVAAAFSLDDAGEQVFVHIVRGAGFGEDLVQIGGREGCGRVGRGAKR